MTVSRIDSVPTRRMQYMDHEKKWFCLALKDLKGIKQSDKQSEHLSNGRIVINNM